MQFRMGVPLISDLEALQRDAFYTEITAYSRDFLSRNGEALKGYGKLWGQDPFKLWSRRWEYPFAAQKAIEYGSRDGASGMTSGSASSLAQSCPSTPLKIIDAGSGVTFFPYFVCDHLPNAEFICIDSNPSYPPMFEAINRNTPGSRVSFANGMLQKLEMPNSSIDCICCISVLEHTDNYGEIVREFARVLKPGGLLVLTFDLSLDGKFELRKDVAADLLSRVAEYFDLGGVPVEQELNRMGDLNGILSTDHVKRTEPELLPWRFPMAKAVHDLVKGHGWTGGFRSKSIFCLAALKK
ncbi:MAG TPA: class I SAM-dependent methyltransferase [Tepidisphaeraceae bacterium]|jgi:SAM-dependent methyltransferase|nr:class I SAM-dependent methyltransferase [Tepidisphaeraceae bacterium]